MVDDDAAARPRVARTLCRSALAFALASTGCGFVAGVDFFGVERATTDLADAATADAQADVSPTPMGPAPHRILVVGGTPESVDLPDRGTSFTAEILGDGSLGPWTSGPDLPAARMYAPLVAGPDFVAMVGGIARGPGERGNFLVGPLDGGLVTSFADSSDAFPKRSRAGAVRHGETVFVLGGQDATGQILSDVRKGTVGVGFVGAFTTSPSLPTPLARAGMTDDDEDLFIVGGHDGSAATDAILRARFVEGDLSPFAIAGRLPAARTSTQALALPGSLLVVGGDAAGSALAEVRSYPRDRDGTLGTSVTTTPLPVGVSRHQMVRDGSFVYVIGGSTLRGPSATVYVGSLTAEGLVTSWREGTPLPEPRVFHAAVRL